MSENVEHVYDRYDHEGSFRGANIETLVIREGVTKIIANTFKRSPVFRIGGDEFLVLIQNRDFRDHEELIKTLYNACEEEIITAGDRRIHVSIALGCAIYDPCTDNNFMDVFNRADSAMYEHKRKMKNSSNGNFTSKYIEAADASK